MSKTLIIGATGLLGQALMAEARNRNLSVLGVARSQADRDLDVSDPNALSTLIHDYQPDLVINAAAIVNLALCEQDPGLAYQINSRPAALLAELSRQTGFKNIQISTDHYYTGDADKRHREEDTVCLLNEYARSKFAAEGFALSRPSALVVRTNIVGHRQQKDQPTFAEWAINSLKNRAPLTLFNDVYSSSIHVAAFSKALFDLVEKDTSGLLNLAARSADSKQAFIEKLAEKLGIHLDWATVGSSSAMIPARAESMGLDVGKAEALLQYQLPDLDDTTQALADAERDLEGTDAA